MKLEKILILSLIPMLSFGQILPKPIDGKVFNSVFQNLETGKFKGTINGVIIIEGLDNKETILDFQGSDAALIVKIDSHEVYDVSTKIYQGKTTSGKTEIEYKTYGSANSIGIYIYNNWFELSFIDGACFRIIDGLDFTYKAENDTEYLILHITKELILSNWQYLMRTAHTTEPDNIEELKPKKIVIKILPNSTIIFAINRNE